MTIKTAALNNQLCQLSSSPPRLTRTLNKMEALAALSFSSNDFPSHLEVKQQHPEQRHTPVPTATRAEGSTF